MSRNKVSNLLISLAFVFNLFIFAPLEFYYLNIVDFWFPIKFVIPTIIVISLTAFFLILLLLNKVSDKKRAIIARLVFGIFIGLYLQGNFLNFGYAQINTVENDWKKMILKGIINTIIWLIIIVVPFVFRKDEKFNIISSILSLSILLIELTTLIVVIIMTYENKDFYLDESKMLEMSNDENIVFLMLDSIEGKYFSNVLDEYPEYKEVFKDFTFFDNCTGASVLTYMSMPKILTGNSLEVGKTLKENVNNCINSELYEKLLENGYRIEWYTDLALVPNVDENNIISNKVDCSLNIRTSDKVKLSKLLYECIFYKYFPHILKAGFNVDSNQFNQVTSKDVTPYFENQAKFYKKLLNNNTNLNSSQKTFKVFETEGCHYPFTLTENVEFDISTEYQKNSIEYKQKNEIIASVKIAEAYINALKTSGAYEKTTIIIAADHGFENRYNPFLLIKRKNEKNDELNVNSAPVSMNEDYVPTLLNIISDSKNYGKDFFDYNENDERERIVNNFYFARDSKRNIFVESNVKMATKGQASNLDSYYILEEEFTNVGSLDDEYKIGKSINLKNENTKYLLTNGLLRRTGDNAVTGTTLGHKCSFILNKKSSDKDINSTLRVNKVFNNQRIIIKIGDNILYKGNFSKKDKDFDINFVIKKELWNSTNQLKIDFEFPDAKTYSDNYISSRFGTDWVIRAFIFDTIKFDIGR